MKSECNNKTEAGSQGPAITCLKRYWCSGFRVILVCGLVSLLTAYRAFPEERATESPEPRAAVSEPGTSPDTTRHPREKTYLKRKWGVEILFVREASAGYMLEFRYKVLDAKKAAPLFVRATKPVLIDAGTGASLQVPTPPTTGALRNSNEPVEGKTYWMFFANPGNRVKQGQRVSIEIGEFRVDDIIVE